MTTIIAPPDRLLMELPPKPSNTPIMPYKRRFASPRTIVALMLREMATTYGRSPGGYIWAILEPVGGIALLSAVFSLTFSHPALGINFPLFYASGLVPFTTFHNLSNKLAQSINFSRPLLAYPSVTFIDAILARFILNMLTEMMVAYIIFSGILLTFETRVIIDIPTVALAILLSGVLGLGVGTLNCFLFTWYPVWQRAWGILMRPMFIISGVFIMFDTLPLQVQYWLWFNPILHVIALMRRGFYTSYEADYVMLSYVLGFSFVCLLFGLLLLRKHRHSLLYR